MERISSAGPATYPMLTKTNYNDWALLMKIKLQARCLWRAIDPSDDVSEPEDRQALDALCSAVPPEMVPTLAVKPSEKLAWEAIRVMRIGDDRVRKTSAQRVRRQYEELALREGEGVEDFALRLTNIVSQLATLGDPEDPTKVVEKYLRIARGRYKQLVVSMETLLDISTLSIEEVTSRLMASDDGPEPESSQAGGKLYLTEEQWLERYKKKETESSRAAGGSSSRGRRRGPKGKGRGAKADDTCNYCGKTGHWARECRGRKKDQQAQQSQQAHVAQDDEPSLLLAHVADVAIDSSLELNQAQAPSDAAVISNPSNTMAVRSPQECVHLVEQKVFAALDEKEERDPRRWIFDTGASNHMTGCRDAFSDFDMGVSGTVRFGNGSTVCIKGRDTVLFECKNGEHCTLSNTFFIPHLTANIVSCGQLDEENQEILIKAGVMRIRDEHHRLLAKIRRGPGRLYVLDLTIARPICLAAHAGEDAWRWHARFGHTNFGALRKMGREGLVRGLPVLNEAERLCDACISGKHRRDPFPTSAQRRSSKPLELLHGDLCGPITPATPSHNSYFLLLVDDYSRFMWVALLPTKAGAAEAIKRIQAAAERKGGCKLLALRTDRGGEFTSTRFMEYCAELGVGRQLTAPYTP